MHFVLLAVLSAVIAPAKSAVRAAALVKQLESQSFKLREAASSELISLGEASRAALEAGMASGDAEVRERCRRILPDSKFYELRRRIVAMQQDTERRKSHFLPGWKAFAARYQNDELARGQYAEVLLGNLELASQFDMSKDNLDRGLLLDYLNQQLQFAFVEHIPDENEICLWLILAADSIGHEINIKLASAVRGEAFAAMLKRAETKSKAQRFLVNWLFSLLDALPRNAVLELAYTLDNEHDLPGMADVACDFLARKKYDRDDAAKALFCLGRHAQPLHRSVLDRFLDDDGKQVYYHVKDGFSRVAYRDLALVAALRCEGLDPRRFGLVAGVHSNPQTAPHSFAFRNEGDQKRGFEMYADWLRK